MKAEVNIQQKPSIIKKTTKILNQKKNSVITQVAVQKQKGKQNFTLNDNLQISSSKKDNLISPKNSAVHYSMVSPKSQGNIDFFKTQKSDLKKVGVGNKMKKIGVTKQEPIIKQNISGIKSPKNGRARVIQSQIDSNSQSHISSFLNDESHLNTELDTSILHVNCACDEMLLQQPHSNTYSAKDLSLLQQSKLQQLAKSSKEQNQEILRLKLKNEELQRKLTKVKVGQEQNRKKLRERINNFNQEGEQMMALKQKISELQKEIHRLQIQNQSINKASLAQSLSKQKQQGDRQKERIPHFRKQIHNLISLHVLPSRITPQKFPNSKMIHESVMTSFQDSIWDGALSFTNQNNLNGQSSIISIDKAKDLSIESCNLIPTLEIQFIKSSYQDKYKEKVLTIQSLYKQCLDDIESRYKLLVLESNQIIKNQEKQIIQLQSKIDDLYQKLQSCGSSLANRNYPITIQTNQQQLKQMKLIYQYKQKIQRKNQQIKHCRQQIRSKQIQCKKILSQLDIQRIKFNLNSEGSFLNKQLLQIVQSEKLQLIKEQLRQQKQKTFKMKINTQKKEELIKKLSAYHQGQKNMTSNIKMRK